MPRGGFYKSVYRYMYHTCVFPTPINNPASGMIVFSYTPNLKDSGELDCDSLGQFLGLPAPGLECPEVPLPVRHSVAVLVHKSV